MINFLSVEEKIRDFLLVEGNHSLLIDAMVINTNESSQVPALIKLSWDFLTQLL